MSDIARSYAEGTALAWEQKMRQEDEDTLRGEEANPGIYYPDDGHAPDLITTPGSFLEGKCRKCGSREHLHTEERKS
jgi:hypothetical protein